MTGRRGLAAAAGVLAVLASGTGAGTASTPVPPGSLLAFGSNEFGQLGVPPTGEAPNMPAPVVLPGANGAVTHVAGGVDLSLVATAGGQLYAFGRNRYGELGSMTNIGTDTPVPPTLVVLPGQSGAVTQISAGTADSLVVTAGGQLYGFGLNSDGELGTGTTVANPMPVLVTLPGQNGAVTAVATESGHTLAATSNGQLYAVGGNSYGQLGVAAHSGTSTPNTVPTLVTLPGQVGHVTDLATGPNHSLVVTASGQLYAFGLNLHGELGSTVNVGTSSPNPTPTLVTLPGEVGPVIQAAAGEAHSLALTSSGQLYAFGLNGSGQLGSAAGLGTQQANPRPVLVALPGATGPVTRIAAGFFHSLAVTGGGQLYGFGDNTFDQLGGGSVAGHPAAITLAPGTTVSDVAQGPEAVHTLAIVSGLVIATSTLPVGHRGLPYHAAPAVSGGTAPFAWAASGLPRGLALDAATGRITGTPVAGGRFLLTVTVTDSDGQSRAHTFRLTVLAAGVRLRAPRLTQVRQSHARWRLRGTGSGALPVGTTFRFTLDHPARVTVRFTGATRGGTLHLRAPAGAHRLPFDGRIAGRRSLVPGRYTVMFTAANLAGVSDPQRLRFTIAPHKV